MVVSVTLRWPVFLAASFAGVLAACNPVSGAKGDVVAPHPAVATLGLDPSVILTPALVSELLAKHGASVVVPGLWNNTSEASPEGLWPQVDSGIISGDAAWIALAPALQPGTDAGTAESLKYALSEALGKNAGAVLAIAQPPFDLTELCTVALIEATPDVVQQAINAAVAGVEAVSDPALAERKAACLVALKASATPAPAPAQ